MALFSYKAVTAEGEVIEGELEALDQRSAIERLRSQGHVPIRAEERRGGGAVRRSGIAGRGTCRLDRFAADCRQEIRPCKRGFSERPAL